MDTEVFMKIKKTLGSNSNGDAAFLEKWDKDKSPHFSFGGTRGKIRLKDGYAEPIWSSFTENVPSTHTRIILCVY